MNMNRCYQLRLRLPSKNARFQYSRFCALWYPRGVSGENGNRERRYVHLNSGKSEIAIRMSKALYTGTEWILNYYKGFEIK